MEKIALSQDFISIHALLDFFSKQRAFGCNRANAGGRFIAHTLNWARA
jgi:drug/metabolite transporter superfamily protein YnfA